MEHMTLRREILDSAPRYDIVSGGRQGGKTAAAAEWLRKQEMERGQYIKGTPFTWYASLHYSDEVWAVLRDRAWRLKQARPQ